MWIWGQVQHLQLLITVEVRHPEARWRTQVQDGPGSKPLGFKGTANEIIKIESQNHKSNKIEVAALRSLRHCHTTHQWPTNMTQQIVTGQKKVRVAASVLMISEESRPDRVESEEVELAWTSKSLLVSYLCIIVVVRNKKSSTPFRKVLGSEVQTSAWPFQKRAVPGSKSM